MSWSGASRLKIGKSPPKVPNGGPLPTKTSGRERPLTFACRHGGQIIGQTVTPICDECRRPLRVECTRLRCTTKGCKRNRVAAKPRHQPKPLCLWVPIARSWALARGYTLHPGTSCVASFTGSSRCWHGWRCVAGARRTSSTNTEEPPDQPRQGFGHPHGWVDARGPSLRLLRPRRSRLGASSQRRPSST